MTSRRILILYGTTYGQTTRIAHRIGEQLRALGYVVTLAEGDHLPAVLDPAAFDGVIVAASVVGGHHQHCIERLVRMHRDALNAVPSAFLSVSFSAASPDPARQAEARRVVEEFVRETGWTPRLTQLVGGAIRYRSYGWFTRWVLRRLCARTGGPTDVTRDHELTDWTQVEQFVDDFTELLAGRRTEPQRSAPVAFG